MKRKISFTISAAVILIVAVIVCVFFMHTPLVKVMSVRGYEISIPKNWSSDSKGNIYDNKGNLAGIFTLSDVDCENPPYLENVDSMISRDFLSDSVSKYEFSQDGENVIIYYIKNLPNPEPYAAELVFYDECVSPRVAEKIYNTFKIPEMGANPPKKNIPAPDMLQSDANMVLITENQVSNLGLLSEFSEKQSAKEQCSVDILEYARDGENTVLKSWYSLESDNGVGYMYSYYQKDDGNYTYDNNAHSFDELLKVISNDEDTTSYLLKAEGKEDVKLIKIPLDRYRDNAKELVALKTENADSAHIQKVMNKILSKDELNGLKIDVSENSVTLQYGEGVESNEADAYSQTAVLFGLTDNINSVTVQYKDGNKYTFTKDQIDKSTKTEINSVADNEKNFIDYTEEIESTHTQQYQNGEVVYSGTVMISYDTMVTHPRTGEQVAIGPYADAKGYGNYIGRGIICVIRRAGDGYIATASCGGSVIASYPLNSEADLNMAIGMIRAYS